MNTVIEQKISKDTYYFEVYLSSIGRMVGYRAIRHKVYFPNGWIWKVERYFEDTGWCQTGIWTNIRHVRKFLRSVAA